ncbi:MAG: GGDEF domain-containing protein [Acholeplasmatales bacterium]|nr:GGDEF domain-containing protein [Acholeplasmatales bacterium]
MYNKTKLMKIPFFKNIGELDAFENVLDSLTKTVSRKYILRFVEHLIDTNTPFSLGIIDLDNFKNVNDNYGHSIGDLVLARFADAVMRYVGDNGLVGRFGGDEFLVVFLGDNRYQSVYEFYMNMYNFGKVVRTNYAIKYGVNATLTATTGSASFPLDATSYEELFIKADKALYRGKMKGRNCVIVYVDYKHKDIDITKNVKRSLYLTFEKIFNIFESNVDFNRKLNLAAIESKESLKISDAFIMDTNFRMLTDGDSAYAIDVDTIESLLDEEGVFSCNTLEDIKNTSLDLYGFCVSLKILSILICKIKVHGHVYGYVVLGEGQINRIWQDDDMALAVYLSKILGMHYLIK